ncbi:hypothetical protein ACFWA6_28160, partial [Streptomyces sp. NPDC060020]|uniref:hypothetical protein n=1 Tax=Streptomyces sp. NPDC060020 TaxID=3347038 RepID=UPI0036BA49EF
SGAQASATPASAAPAAPGGAPPAAAAPVAQATGDTPRWVVGAIRHVLLICLIVGALAAFAGPLLPRFLPRLLPHLRALRAGAAHRDEGR